MCKSLITFKEVGLHKTWCVIHSVRPPNLHQGKASSVHAMKEYIAVEVQLYRCLTSPLDGSEWSVSCPGFFNSEKRVPDAPQPAWMFQRREKFLAHARNLTP
jgi:hypothetical protein